MSSCFALVRPTGMSDHAAEDWLAVASAELAGYPVHLVSIGCDAARQECTHHSQIVPFVLKKIREMRPWSTLDELRFLPSQKAERIEYAPEVQGLIDHAVKALKNG